MSEIASEPAEEPGTMVVGMLTTAVNVCLSVSGFGVRVFMCVIVYVRIFARVRVRSIVYVRFVARGYM